MDSVYGASDSDLTQNRDYFMGKARADGIFTRVGEVSEIERVSAANE